ncbi:hypothetical protein Q0M94_21955 (plasmid) [Deinococcus radiomollis]|uniref:hypothetical protein n=1 Tax=Deinococcus radiomollis TaxID=468916 RepID=UPI00389256CD
MKNQRERYLIGLILMTIALINLIISSILWAQSSKPLDAVLIIFNSILFICGMILTLRKGVS